MVTTKSLKIIKESLNRAKEDKKLLSKSLADVIRDIKSLDDSRVYISKQIDEINDTIEQLNIDINASIPT